MYREIGRIRIHEGSEFGLVTVKQRYEEYLLKHPTCVVIFKKIATNVKDNYLTTDGFIDEEKNGWEIVSMKLNE